MNNELRQSLASLKRPIYGAKPWLQIERTEKQQGEMEYRYDPEKQEHVVVRCGEVGGV